MDFYFLSPSWWERPWSSLNRGAIPTWVLRRDFSQRDSPIAMAAPVFYLTSPPQVREEPCWYRHNLGTTTFLEKVIFPLPQWHAHAISSVMAIEIFYLGHTLFRIHKFLCNESILPFGFNDYMFPFADQNWISIHLHKPWILNGWGFNLTISCYIPPLPIL